MEVFEDCFGFPVGGWEGCFDAVETVFLGVGLCCEREEEDRGDVEGAEGVGVVAPVVV